MMNKKKFAEFIDNLNQQVVNNKHQQTEYLDIEGYKVEYDGKTYHLIQIDDQRPHDEICDNDNKKLEYSTINTVFQLVYNIPEDDICRECNFYALSIRDFTPDKKVYFHDLIPMIKVKTYHPEVVIPPHEEENYIFL